MQKFVSYLRVSTQKQGASGLGLEAQRAAVQAFVAGKGGTIVAEFVEVETGKGANALELRPQLRAALELCKKDKKDGKTLVIAKLDRLARSVAFTSGLMAAGVDIVAADMPTADKVMMHMHAVMAEWERDQISARTKAALAAAKARGVKLGTTGPANLKDNIEARQAEADAFAEKLRGILGDLQKRGLSQRAQVAELNKLDIKTAKGGAWSLVQLQRVRARLEAPAA